PPILLHDEPLELLRVDEVAVVREADAERRIHVERLRFGRARGARRRITHMADADVAAQPQHVALLEHVAHEPVALARVQPAVRLRDDTRRILTAVLQDRQRIVERLVDRLMADDSDYSAHLPSLCLASRGPIRKSLLWRSPFACRPEPVNKPLHRSADLLLPQVGASERTVISNSFRDL